VDENTLHARLAAAAAATLLVALLPQGCDEEQEAAPVASTSPSPSRETAPAFEAPEVIWFEEVDLGIDFTHRYADERRFWMPETVGAGLAFLDVNGDGHLDLYAVQSGDAEKGGGFNSHFQNDGKGGFADVTARQGGGDPGYGMGCAAADYDGDGDTDLYVTNLGPNVLFRNEGGRLDDVGSQSSTNHEGWGTSTAFLDYDSDGDLDLFVTNYLNWNASREIECSTIYSSIDYCSPKNYNAPAQDVLYRNEGGVRFTEATRDAGINSFGNGLGVATGDFDGNGHVDIYVANDLMANHLWANQGNGKFVDDALIAGCAVNMNGVAEAGMGVVAHDFQDDGDLDLFMTHLNAQSNTFYVNEDGSFSDETIELGLAAPSLQFTGFGVGFAYFYNDGLDDLFVANGRVAAGRPFFDPGDVYAEPNLLLRGVDGGRFEEVAGCGLASPAYGNTRGAAFGDYDSDGDVDVALLENGAPLRLLANVRNSDHHWIQVRVLERNESDAVGARVAFGSLEKPRWRYVQPGYSYCSSNDPAVHLGLGRDAGAITVRVHWADGEITNFGELEADRRHVVQRQL